MDKTFQRILLSIGFFLIISGFVFASNTIIRSTNSEIVGNVNITGTLKINGNITLPTYNCIVNTDGTGNYKNIQDCINYVNTTYNGGTVFVKNGNYIINNTINLTNNLILVGEGKATIIASSTVITDMIKAIKKNNITVDNLILKAGINNVNGINLYQTNNSKINNNIIYNTSKVNRIAIILTGNNIISSNNYVENATSGYYIAGEDIIVHNNILKNIDGDIGFGTEYKSDTTINSKNIVISNNVCNYCYYGVGALHTDYITISNNILVGRNEVNNIGIGYAYSTGESEFGTITGNSIKEFENGLVIGSSITKYETYTSISGNVIYKNIDAGIKLNSDFNTMTGNTIHSATSGIDILEDNNIVSSNIIINNTNGIIIRATGTKNVISSNHLVNNTNKLVDDGSSNIYNLNEGSSLDSYYNKSSDVYLLNTGDTGNGVYIIQGADTGGNTGNVIIKSTDTAGINKGGSLSFGGAYDGTTQTEWAKIDGKKENAVNGEFGGYLSFLVRPQGGLNTESLRINSNQSAYFTQNLRVNGDFKANNYYSGDNTQGMTGTCGSATTLTVKDGLITACS